MHVVGCPRIDLVAEVIGNGGAELDAEWLEREGVGGHISTDQPFLLVSQHPVTTEYGQAEEQITETLHGAARAADADDHALAERRRRL